MRTEWRVVRNSHGERQTYIVADERVIATMQMYWNLERITEENIEANAQFICKCVNNHDELVEACEAVPRILYGLSLDARQSQVVQRAIDQCRAVLKEVNNGQET